MTDEEMADKLAEDYVMREDTITENDRVPFDNGYGFQTVDFEKEVKKGYKDGFLAGLNAGRPQWHDLRKDPNDLPNLDKTDMSDYVITDKGVAYYNGRVKSWYIQNEYILSNDVIAWCEIPTFDKE